MKVNNNSLYESDFMRGSCLCLSKLARLPEQTFNGQEVADGGAQHRLVLVGRALSVGWPFAARPMSSSS